MGASLSVRYQTVIWVTSSAHKKNRALKKDPWLVKGNLLFGRCLFLILFSLTSLGRIENISIISKRDKCCDK